MPEHRTSPLTYAAVFGGLLLLTLLTVLVSYSNLGVWTVPAALTIAVTKATLVVLFFMHLLHSSKLTWIILAAGLFWLGIMLALTLSDYLSRSWLIS